MSHDLYADWACIEIARIIRENSNEYFTTAPANLAVYATREGGRSWPICDGVISITADNVNYNLAIEMKRVNEGLHGILTAIGQSQAYIHKGFNASVIVIPNRYIGHNTPGAYLSEVIQLVSNNQPILIFSYEDPDANLANPFFNKLTCHRFFNLNTATQQNTTNVIRRTETQWGHVREGSTDPHAFYTYLSIAKKYGLTDDIPINVTVPPELIAACNSLGAFNGDVLKFLSCSPGDTFHDRIWRKFWFESIIHTNSLPIWDIENDEQYSPNDVSTKIYQPNGTYKKFFVGRADSKKNVLCSKLNNGEISEEEAWLDYAENIRDRAHSYREDIDSGLSAFGLLEDDGKPTNLAYKFVDAVERYNTWDTALPRTILGYALLINANFLSFLHYVYRLTEDKMEQDNFSFYDDRFDRGEYLVWLRNELAANLCVMRTVTLRGGQTRLPFQAELAILRQYNFVKGFRIGTGLEINWPLIHETIDSFKSSSV